MSKSEASTPIQDTVYGDMTDVQYEIMFKVSSLIGAKWDSPTLKKEIEGLIDDAFRLEEEIELLQKKEKEAKEKKE